ncbi:FecR domain-containing protein [Caenimonas sedimenti]|nr:FecR domain-containing protein [Caenimonas sedimenti]
MHFPRRLVTRAALAACAVGSQGASAQCAGTALAPGATAAEIVSLTGRGETRPLEAQPWSAAFLAQRLAPGADMRTLALSSAALLLSDRTQLRLSAGAQLRLCEATPERTLLELAAGRLWARTKKAPATLQLQTPAALAVVRGTDWDVEVGPQGHTLLTVLSGKVELSNAYGSVDLGPAEQGFVEPGKPPVKRLLVRPRDRVQWVMAHTVDPMRWAEFQQPAVDPQLAAVRADFAAGNLGGARERLLALRAANAGGAVVELLLADLEVADSQLDAAQSRLAQAWQRHRDPRAAARRADLLMAMDRGALARAWLDETLAVAPTAPELLLADADWYRLEGAGPRALMRYRETLTHAASDMQKAAAHWGLGRALQERGDWRAANASLAQAVSLAPGNPTYRGELATAASENLRLAEARTGFDAALAIAGDDYVSLAGSGLLTLQEGQAEAARTQLLKALVIEPRYARAQVWLAEAEYTLGERPAALDSLARAQLADPNDPVPWQVQAIVLNDSGEPTEAIAASREALARLPFLKSLNPLTSDSQGSANLGKALGDFGLEHWARAYANASYYPLWAGSHFFLADRYESDFNRKSELFQGYLADPTVFGASEKRAPLLLMEGSEWAVGASAERNPLRHNATVDAGHRGFNASAIPFAWLVRGNSVQMWPREGPPTSQYRLSSPAIDLAIGARPVESLGVFLLHSDSELRSRFPAALDLGNGITVSDTLRTRPRRTDAGASWRWSADNQTWLKLHHGVTRSSLVLDDAAFGPQDYDYESKERGVFLRHTLVTGPWRLSGGWEQVRRDTGSAISDPQVVSPRTNTERYAMPWVAAEWRGGAWSAQAELYRPVFTATQLDRFTDPAGQDLLDPTTASGGQRRRTLPRFGVSHSFGPGRAIHAAYQESVRAPGTHTLAPVATGAIPIDNQYQLAGSFARKKAVQLDWEATPSTFLGAALSQQSISNPVDGNTGRLFAQNTGVLFDNIATIAPVVLNAQTSLNTYKETPIFSQGRIRQASASINQLLGPRWSVLGSYIHARSRNTGETFAGNALPGFPRSTVLAQTTWRHANRSFSLAGVTWRGTHFGDEANSVVRPAGWTLGLAHGWESDDRHWRLTASVQSGLRDGEKPTLFLLLRYRQ